MAAVHRVGQVQLEIAQPPIGGKAQAQQPHAIPQPVQVWSWSFHGVPIRATAACAVGAQRFGEGGQLLQR